MYNSAIMYAMLIAYKCRDTNKYTIEFITTKMIKNIKIAKSTLYEWIHLYSDMTVEQLIKKRQNRINIRNNTKINNECEMYIRSQLLQNPIKNLKKLRIEILNNFFIKISIRTIRNVLKKHNITYKTVQLKTINKKNNYKNETIHLYESLKRTKNNYNNVDETSVELYSKPKMGYSKKGHKCIVNKINKRKRYSLITSMDRNKIIYTKIIDGSVNGEIFKNFIDKVNKKTKKTLMMDNAKIHHYKGLKQLASKKNIKIIYNVPYSPEYAPIELYHNTLKNKLYQCTIESLEDLQMEVNKVVKEINKKGCHKYFNKTYNILEKVIRSNNW